MGIYNTPLRYPGGKQKISPFIIEILEKNNLLGCNYVEPYAGGAGVAIDLLLGGYVSKIYLNDSCPCVYSFWHSILNEPEEFCRRISRASLNIEEWKKQRDIIRNPYKVDRIDLGYAMFYLNRCNRSGILTGGVIGGLKQTGKWKIDARFPRVELIRRIEAIVNQRKSIKLKNWDAEKYIINYLPRLDSNTFIYCDPPYFNKADKLYLNHYTPEDHKRIAMIISNIISHPWIVSYDNNEIITCLYKNYNKFVYQLQYNAFKAYKGSEIFIFSNKLLIPDHSSIHYINKSLVANKFICKFHRLRTSCATATCRIGGGVKK